MRSPAWRTWWAVALYVLALAGSLGGFARFQQRELRRERDVAQRLRDIDQIRVALVADLEDRVADRTARIEALMDDLRARNTELESFTYSVSHDLKSPLVTVKGFLGFLEKDVAAGDAERLARDIEHIRGAVDQMQHLIDDLLELSRIGRKIDTAEELDMGTIAREVVQLLAGEIEERGVELVIADDLPNALGDPTRLRQVYQNLFSNAVKYMGDEPRPRVEVGIREDEGETVFWVRDNGMGIEAKHQRRIFGLFQRLDGRSAGSGVGLALVKRIVEAHGGRIWVESEGAGTGSTFCFTLAGVS